MAGRPLVSYSSVEQNGYWQLLLAPAGSWITRDRRLTLRREPHVAPRMGAFHHDGCDLGRTLFDDQGGGQRDRAGHARARQNTNRSSVARTARGCPRPASIAPSALAPAAPLARKSV